MQVYSQVGMCFVQMSALLADVGLNILEAHVFSTTDGYSLAVFVVDGWQSEVYYALFWVCLLVSA